MLVTKCLVSLVKIRIFCPKTTKIGIFVHFGPGLAGSFGGLVGGCGARAVSRKTPIYFILKIEFAYFMIKYAILSINLNPISINPGRKH